MKSPFPGMDPFLERHWLDVHHSLCQYARDMLNEQIGRGSLRARLGERLIVEQDWHAVRPIEPGVIVVEHGIRDRPVSPMRGVALAEPIVVRAAGEPQRQPFIHIIDPTSGGRLVTAVEFLSPTNKHPGDGRNQYRRKQQEVLDAGAHLVEIDLTRAGRREFLYPEANLPPECRSTYLACVMRNPPRRFEFYPMPLRQRLPAIRVPLRDQDPDVVLNIQALIDEVVSKGFYDNLEYDEPCVPPLDESDAAWAAEVVRNGVR